MKRDEETGNDHELVDANWSGVRIAMAVAASFCFIMMLVGANIVYDIERTRAEIPAMFEGKSLIETLSPKRKQTQSTISHLPPQKPKRRRAFASTPFKLV